MADTAMMVSHRMLSKGSSARVVIKLRSDASQGPTIGIPLEIFAVNKGMGRIALRRAGETVAAGASACSKERWANC